MTGSLPPLLNKRELRALGWSPALIALILGNPDKKLDRKRGAMKWSEHLYTRERILAGCEDARFLAAQQKRQARLALAKAAMEAIPTHYADWRAALPDAATGLLSLNRYAKWRACSPFARQEIYELKHSFVELLYRHGYCTASWLHKIPEQVCRECEGFGGWCEHCGGSGVWRDATFLWCFRFRIDGKNYCWHQPRALVSFLPSETLPPQDWVFGALREKPVRLARRRFAEAKRLLGWVIAGAREEAPAEDAIPFDRGRDNPLLRALGA